MSSWFSNDLTNSGPFQVTLDRGEWIDARRHDRKVPYKIYRPMADAGLKFPVIVWSHGLGGSRDGAGFLARYITSYGYILVHIQHAGTDSSLWEGKPGHPWDVIRAQKIPRKATLQRFQDVPFASDQLFLLNDAQMDLTHLGMSGHSFGSLSTQMACGQTRGHGRHMYRVADDRITCGIAYSPVTVQKKFGQPPSDFYKTINRPMMYMTGTDDASPVIPNYSYLKRMEVFEHAGGPDQHMVVKIDGDHMVYNGSRGGLGANDKRELHERIICVASLAFWDSYLKENSAAKDWLTKGGFADWINGDGEYHYRP